MSQTTNINEFIMTREEKHATWERMVKQAQEDFVHYKALPDERSAFGRRFRDVRLAECETILAVDATLRKRSPDVSRETLTMTGGGN